VRSSNMDDASTMSLLSLCIDQFQSVESIENVVGLKTYINL
jgi:hypothetical protein